ncbi:MAG: PhzF family phenazine biosynthesis protein [Clostridia bacterium]|nr:PhzF family phenazine biosynthesis protein [Clostridia bacterium]
MKKKIYQVDAFTSEPFQGNPAGVVTDATGLTEREMLLIAREMKLSETAFVFPGGEGYDFEVRFFTPTEEVDLCGHATIATFSLLKALKLIPKDKHQLIQKTKAGLLEIKFVDDAVIMRQATPMHVSKEIEMAVFCEAMAMDAGVIGVKNLMGQPEIWSTGLADVMLPVASVEVLKSLAPDMNKLADLSRELDVSGVHAFTIDEHNQIWCRNFAPACGIPEESATGTSNGALGACLHAKGYQVDGVLAFESYQGDWMDSPSRIHVEVKGEDGPEVWVGGKAAVVLEGEIRVR